MRIYSKIIFIMNPIEAEIILAPLGFQAGDDIMQVAKAYTDTYEYLCLKDALQNQGVEYTEAKEAVYSRLELEQSELLEMVPYTYCGYPQPDGDFGYEAVSYDLSSACSKCKQGLVQINPLMLKKPKMGRNDISAIHWVYEFVVTHRTKSIIESSGLTGWEFWPIIDYKTKNAGGEIYQLIVNSIMPPLSLETNIQPAKGVKMCPCGKKGYTMEGTPVYNRSSLVSVKDFNKTLEWLGGAEKTWQIVIVSNKVYQLFEREKIKGVQFRPITIIEN